MKTPAVPTVTDELIADLEAKAKICEWAGTLPLVHAWQLSALLAERADHLQQLAAARAVADT